MTFFRVVQGLILLPLNYCIDISLILLFLCVNKHIPNPERFKKPQYTKASVEIFEETKWDEGYKVTQEPPLKVILCNLVNRQILRLAVFLERLKEMIQDDIDEKYALDYAYHVEGTRAYLG